MPIATPDRVLFIDAYDSFTNNIVSLLETRLNVEVTVIKIDDDIKDFSAFLKPFAAAVAGPGPGDPRRPRDVGLIEELWKLSGEDSLPVLGICLGFQSLVYHFGGKIETLPEPRHGTPRRVRSNGESIFAGILELETVQYHSLHARLPAIRDACVSDQQTTHNSCSTLKALAWDYVSDSISSDCSPKISCSCLPEVLMAVEHTSKPLFGIQFHAESICSSEDARRVVDAWWHTAVAWNTYHGDRYPLVNGYPTPPQEAEADVGTPLDMALDAAEACQPLKYRRTSDLSRGALHSLNHKAHLPRLPAKYGTNPHDGKNGPNPYRRMKTQKIQVVTKGIDVNELTIPSICETLKLTNGEAMILDSELHQRREVGEFSILGLISPGSLRFEYNVDRPEMRRIFNGITTTADLNIFGGSICSYLKAFMKNYPATSQNIEIPFWGGLMGYISYEACLDTIDMSKPSTVERDPSGQPDMSFVFVERSIVVNHSIGKLYVQSIKPTDDQWVTDTASILQDINPTSISQDDPVSTSLANIVTLPNEDLYKSQVRTCQQHIRAGDSYELCLTTQATIKTERKQHSWPLYQRLRNLNPSPFSAYLRLGKLTLLSSSPERFLRWSRPLCRKYDDEEEIVTCQFRPIKGTVKHQPDPDKPPLTLAEATALLSTPKERAENLMIVDLIRHDLHGVVGSGNVTVPKLMVVEEYATLFQLVSVIEGTLAVDYHEDADKDQNISLSSNTSNNQTLSHSPRDLASPPSPVPQPNRNSGIDILASSLPPGSMTGAPKLRSCQLLQALENRNRGIYSGVVGYMDVGGGGDFSVVIRSAVRWDDDVHEGGSGDDDGDEWTIGAGGAVTAMSTEEGEWEEMIAKLKSTLRLFEDGG